MTGTALADKVSMLALLTLRLATIVYKVLEQLCGLMFDRQIPVSVRSSVKPSRFQSLMVLSADVVTICLLSGLNKHFRTCLPTTQPEMSGDANLQRAYLQKVTLLRSRSH